MRIERLHPARLAGERLEVSIVIDVLRATSTAVALLARGCGPLRIVATASELERVAPSAPPAPGGAHRPLVFSELREVADAWPSVDNSPAAAESIPLDGRIPVLVSTNGTRAVQAAVDRSRVTLLGALVNLSATVAAVRALAPGRITLLPAGSFAAAEERTEDERCADAFEQLLRGERPDLPALIAACRADARVRRRLERRPELAADFDIAFSIDRYAAAVEVRSDPPGCVARRRTPPPSRASA